MITVNFLSPWYAPKIISLNRHAFQYIHTVNEWCSCIGEFRDYKDFTWWWKFTCDRQLMSPCGKASFLQKRHPGVTHRSWEWVSISYLIWVISFVSLRIIPVLCRWHGRKWREGGGCHAGWTAVLFSPEAYLWEPFPLYIALNPQHPVLCRSFLQKLNRCAAELNFDIKSNFNWPLPDIATSYLLIEVWILVVVSNSSQGLRGVFWTRWLAKDARKSMVGTLPSHQLDLHSKISRPLPPSVREVQIFRWDIEQVSELIVWVLQPRVSLPAGQI